MSFVLRRYPAQKAAERKTRIRRKPNWDSTTKDLSVHKASAEEQSRRKLVHQSKNMDLVKADLMKKTLRKATLQGRDQQGSKRNNSLLREVLFDESQLHSALASSDRALEVVKDIFGDDPKKFRGLPNVTMAPENSAMDNSLPETATLRGPFKLDALSKSVMDRSALNDLDATDPLSSDYEDADSTDEMSYTPAVDMQRFERLLRQAHGAEASESTERRVAEKLPKPLIPAAAGKFSPQSTGAQVSFDASLDEPVTHEGSYLAAVETPLCTPQPLVKTTAINDTANVKRTMAYTSQQVVPPGGEMVNGSGGGGDAEKEAAILSDMKRVLSGAEVRLTNCDGQAGDHHHGDQQDETFSGYAMALVNTVDNLTSFVKETEMKLRVERTLREHLREEVTQMRLLVDALTSDIISSQEENACMHLEFNKFKTSAERDILCLKKALQSHGIRVENGDNSTAEQTRQSSASVVPTAVHSLDSQHNRLAAPRDVVVSLPRPRLPSQPPASHPAPPCQPAFLLSPPKQAMSPVVLGGKVQPSMDAIQSAVRVLKNPPAQRSATSRHQEAPPTDHGDVSNRPIPQNPQIPYDGSGDAPSTIIGHQMVQADAERAALQRQLEELNLQHVNAQNKLASLMSDHQLAMPVLSKDTTTTEDCVSPSLSPISLASEHHHHHQRAMPAQATKWGAEGVKRGSTAREIRVSIPRMDMLEDSPPPSVQPVR